MRRADRLFQIVQLLRTRRLLTAAQLAEELGVSVRTIYRDIRDLQEADVAIRGEAGVGYALDRGYALPPLTFTTDELEALVLGARIVQTWADDELAEAARSSLRKVEAAVPAALRPVLLDTQLFAASFRKPDRARTLGPLRRALSEGRRIHFAYTREDGTRTERSARPLGLYYWGRVWSLAAWCELRQDYRNFRPDRMADLELLDVVDEDDGIDLDGYVEAMRRREGRGG